MKAKILLGICSLCYLLLSLASCDNRKEEEKLAHSAMNKTKLTLENRYNLKSVGWSEGGDSGFYKRIGLHFRIYRIITKDEGRKILIDGVGELLKEINAVPQLQPFLNPSPFMPENVEITILDFQPNGKTAYYPDILVFSANDGKIQYKTKIPEKEFGYYTKEEETYEEALNIVRSQEAAEQQ